ncbi:MAG: NAD(P)H-dependent oxidoreductase [Christensenellales bacterium]|jgi:NAD(P)H dehydrogenase (quinone)
MNTLIIYSHPYPGSFNHAILEKVKEALEAKGKPYEVIDLCADGFDPRYSVEELALFNKGGTLDPLVTAYQEKIKNADAMVVIAPVWWCDVPAVLKGFLDKVMKPGFAYESTPVGIKGSLTHIKSVLAITTASSPTWYLRLFAGNAIKNVFLNTSMKQLGVAKRKWMNCGQITNITQEAREKFLEKVKEAI